MRQRGRKKKKRRRDNPREGADRGSKAISFFDLHGMRRRRGKKKRRKGKKGPLGEEKKERTQAALIHPNPQNGEKKKGEERGEVKEGKKGFDILGVSP